MPSPTRLYTTDEVRSLDNFVRVNALLQMAGGNARWAPDARGLSDATRFFLDKGVRLHPTWVDPRGTNIVGVMQGVALKKLKDPAAALGLVDEIISGDSLRSHRRGEIGHAAEGVKDDVMGGASTNKFMAFLLKHLGQRMNALVRGTTRRRNRETPIVMPGAGDDVATNEPAVVTLPDADRINSLASDPMVRRWVEDTLENMPGPDFHKDIYLAFLDDPGRRGLKADLARQYDVTGKTVIDVITKGGLFLRTQLKRDPKQWARWQELLNRGEIAELQHESLSRYASSGDPARRIVAFVALVSRVEARLVQHPSAERVAARWLRR